MNDLGWAVTGLVLWVIVGGAGLVLIWVLTVYGTMILGAVDKLAEGVAVLVGGIILWVLALILVVYNVVLSIISVVQNATGG